MSNQPTIFQGNAIFKANSDTSTFGDGSVEVEGNLLVRKNLTIQGSVSEHQVETMIIEDNLTALNEPPQAAGYDGGVLISRYSTDVTAGTPTESGTAQAGAATTITLDAVSTAVDDFYNNWYIRITGGIGAGQVKQITDYVGATRIATVDSNWTTNPDATSTYDLFGKVRIAVMWDESENEIAFAGTADDHTTTVVNVVEYCDAHVRRIVQEQAQECVYYVGAHGNDADTGFHINEAKLTFGAALTAAAAESPDADNQIVVRCEDACLYTENITIPEWVHVYAPNAQLDGTIVLAANASVVFRTQEISSGTAITKNSSGYALAQIDIMTLTGSADGVSNAGVDGQLKFINRQLFVEDGIAITNAATGDGYLNGILCDVIITGTGTALQNTAVTSLNVYLHQIVESGTGTAIDLDSGTANIIATKINTTTACDLAAATTLNMYVGEITGAETVAGGATSNKLPALEVRTHIDDMTGNPHCVTINQANTKESLLTTKGDLFIHNGTSVIKLPVGTNTQILTADSTVAAGVKWATAGGGGTTLATYTLLPGQALASNINYTRIGNFPWLDSKYNGYSAGVVVFQAVISNRNLDVRLQDVTNATTLGSLTGVSATGSYSFVVANPISDAEVELQVRKTAGGGNNPRLNGVVLEFNV